MKKITRTSRIIPKEKTDEWGKDWENKLTKNPKVEFKWRTHKQKGYDEQLEQLLKMTDNCCTYCEIHGIKQSGAEIDHFKSKKKFPLEAYEWENLFPTCSKCNKDKGEDEIRLKPDSESYSFNENFIVDPETWKVKGENSEAEEFIRVIKLNEYARPEAREREYKKYLDSKNPIKHKWNYFSYIQCFINLSSKNERANEILNL